MVAVGIGEVAGIATPVGLDRRLHDARAALLELPEDRVDILARPGVMGESDPSGRCTTVDGDPFNTTLSTDT